MIRVLACLALAIVVSACGTLHRVAELGQPPAMSPPADPTQDPRYRPLTMPTPDAQSAPAEVNSLWRQGARAFFRDQRAAQVGDIVTVLVNITDAADLQNKTATGRTGSQDMGMPHMFGVEGYLPSMLRDAVAANLVSVNSNGVSAGTAAIKRNETVTLRLAGVITQVLANGNLVVSARQEVRVNSELRELTVAGVIRSQDIASDNTVQHDRMAEARIAYGGRGQLTYAQSPRYGQQLLDTLLPF
jgi:flagellar L-ring protein precursor FlgH